jgi:hypothetical protein
MVVAGPDGHGIPHVFDGEPPGRPSRARERRVGQRIDRTGFDRVAGRCSVGAAAGSRGVGEHRPATDEADEGGREVGDPAAGADEFGEPVVGRRRALDDLGMPPDRLVGDRQRGQGSRRLLMGPRLDHRDGREVSERPEEGDLLLREGMPRPMRGEEDPDELALGD